mgnify:CR=1 FL=1
MTEARILLVDGDPQDSRGYQAQLEADEQLPPAGE